MPDKRKNYAGSKTCSCCQVDMPRDPDGHEVAVGWKLLRVEKHGAKEIEIKHHLLCERCTIMFKPRQTSFSLPTPPAPAADHPNPETPR